MNFKSLLILLFLIFSVNTAFTQSVDTLRVYQNDTLVFNSTTSWVQRPCRKPEWVTTYEMRNPKDSMYYFIYNEEGQLDQEGMYRSRFVDGVEYKGIYDSKYYSYHKNGNLFNLLYWEDGHSVKREFYNKRGRLRKKKTVYYGP